MTLIDSQSMKDVYLLGRYLSVFASHSRRANSGRFQRAGVQPEMADIQDGRVSAKSYVKRRIDHNEFLNGRTGIYTRGSKFNLHVSERA